MPLDTRSDAVVEELRSQRNSVFDQFGTIIANLRGELAVANSRITELEAAQAEKKEPRKPGPKSKS